MPAPALIALVSIAYLGLLFAIAFYADKRADAGRSVIASPYVYALSLGVYATSWTFYGSVGRAAANGVGFLPIYLGPTLAAALFWLVLRKIVRISRENRITSIADFIASRYGKSAALAGIVTVIAVVGIVPYIALQLKAVSGSFLLLANAPEVARPTAAGAGPLFADTAFYAALALAVFAILFGARHLDAAERHEGMVAAIAFESVVKLVAFLAIGLFVTFGLYAGFDDLFARVAADPRLAHLLAPFDGPAGSYASWAWLLVLSAFAILCLPRQFQMAVVENVDERHIAKASWLFPLYMFAINLFVLPIAFGGLLHFPGGAVDADTFVLALPIAEGRPLLALAVFLGGLSAATGMVIVETVALSTMVCNDLVMPLAAADGPAASARAARPVADCCSASGGAAIVGILLLGYAYFRFAGEAYALVAIGLISFAAVAQFAPAMLGGLYWKQATRAGRDRRPARGVRGLGVHAARAVVRQVRLAPGGIRRGRTVGRRAAEAARALRPGRPRRDHPQHDLEHARQLRRARRRVAARGAGSAASRRRRCASSTCFAGRPGAWARGAARPRSTTCAGCSGRFLGGDRAAALLEEFAARKGVPMASAAARMPSSCSSRRPSSPAPSGRPRRARRWRRLRRRRGSGSTRS